MKPGKLVSRVSCFLLASLWVVGASEFHPQLPFAGMVDVPKKGQWVLTPWFTYSAFQSYWQGEDEIDVSRGDNEYDNEYYSGQLLVEYSPWHRWAFDLTVGYVNQATRCFNEAAEVQGTDGLMDIQLGIRYEVSRESPEQKWTPDFTLRVGGIFPGTYDPDFPFAPGYGEVGIEPGVLVRKTFWGRGGEYSGGLYGAAAYRHMTSFAPDSILLSAGFFQRFERVTIMAGWRQQQALSGPDVSPNTATPDPWDVIYTNRMKEMNYMAVWGGTYTLPSGVVLRFFMDSNWDGRNTGEKLTYYGAVSLPF